MGGLNVLSLGALISAVEKDYELVSDLPEVHVVPRTKINFKLHDPLTDGLAISKITRFYPPDAGINLIPSDFIPKRKEPISKGLCPLSCFIVFNFSLLGFHACLDCSF
jgi:hypothetical protein